VTDYGKPGPAGGNTDLRIAYGQGEYGRSAIYRNSVQRTLTKM
jgi:hypothetical protein